MSLRSEIPDILLFMRRVGPLHAEQMASIAKHTKQSYNIICAWDEDKTAPASLNGAIARSTSRWVVIMDDDVVILDDYWLQTLIKILDRNEDVALIAPRDLKTPEARRTYTIDPSLVLLPGLPRLVEVNWNCGFLNLWDRSRFPELHVEENIPGGLGSVGLVDVDWSFQIRQAGLKVAITNELAVYHPFKPTDAAWRKKYGMKTDEEGEEIHHAQCKFMEDKWGDMFRNTGHQQSLGILEGSA